jgi:ribosomal protein S18 acetylase RimI-like enzyme
MTLVPADALSLEELTALFNAGYEDYVVPFHVDAAQLGSMIAAWHIDLARSRVSPGEGVALLGVRGDRGWIGGLGVVPASRRRGLGRALLEAVLAEAPPEVTLEVIEQNEPAIRLYEDLGFGRVRILEVWSLDTEVPPALARVAEPSPAGEADLPWQRADASLRPGYERLEVDGGAAVIRASGGTVSLLQLRADDAEAARALVAAARSRGTRLRYVNVPEGSLGAAAIAQLGGKLDLRQFEMSVTRRSSAPRY